MNSIIKNKLSKVSRWVNTQATKVMLYVLFIALISLSVPIVFCRFLNGMPLLLSLVAILAAILAVSWIFISRFFRTYDEIEDGLNKFAKDRSFRLDTSDIAGYDAQNFAVNLNSLFSQIADAEEVNHEMIRNISHEIKTPLTSMKIIVEGIEDGIFPADAENLKMIGDAARRIDETVAIIKRYSDIGFDEHLVECDVATALLESSKRAKVILGNSDVDVEVKSKNSPNFAVNTMATDALLEMIFDMITANAIEHAEGMTLLEYSIATVYNPIVNKDMIKVSIADDGCGIPEEKLSKITIPFYKVDESHTRDNGSDLSSVGLGLPMAEKAMNSVGGMLEIASKENIGTCVSMWFPISQSK